MCGNNAANFADNADLPRTDHLAAAPGAGSAAHRTLVLRRRIEEKVAASKRRGLRSTAHRGTSRISDCTY